MDKGKVLRNRPLKLLTLLLTSVLIATASAAVYNYMYLKAISVTAKTAKVTFALGDDSFAVGAQIDSAGTYVSLNSMSGWPNATRVYEQAVNISNGDTKAHKIELAYESWNGPGQIDLIVVKLYAANGSQMGSDIIVGSTSSTGQVNMPAGDIWRVQWEIKWKATASDGDTVNITLKLTVEGEGAGE